MHVTQHATVLWSQILLHTKGSLLRVCQNEDCHQVNNVPLRVSSIAITLTAKVVISHSSRCFISANSSALTLGFSKGWDIYHDLDCVLRVNVCVLSNIWFHGPFRCLSQAACGFMWTFWDLRKIWRGLPHWSGSMTDVKSKPDNYLHVKLACQKQRVAEFRCGMVDVVSSKQVWHVGVGGSFLVMTLRVYT